MTIELLGTSHISAQSITEIKEKAQSLQPQIIAVELDRQRATSLLQEQQNKVSIAAIKQIGVKGFMFAKLGQYVQKTLGKHVGVAPGSDMKAAMLIAKEKNIQLALIDQPIDLTLKKFSKNFSWRERFRFVGDIFRGVFKQKQQMQRLGLDKIDLRKVPPDALIEKMIHEVQDRYPSVYQVLIEDRNKYMVRSLVSLQRKHPSATILAIVGAGHVKGMKELLNKVDIVK